MQLHERTLVILRTAYPKRRPLHDLRQDVRTGPANLKRALADLEASSLAVRSPDGRWSSTPPAPGDVLDEWLRVRLKRVSTPTGTRVEIVSVAQVRASGDTPGLPTSLLEPLPALTTEVKG